MPDPTDIPALLARAEKAEADLAAAARIARQEQGS